jgi:superfamily II DNA or RNA helicase
MKARTLRPYQTACVEAVLRAYDEGFRRVLYGLPTGSGKTAAFTSLTDEFLARFMTVLVLVHGKELVTQAYEDIKANAGLDEFDIDIEMGSRYARSSPLPRPVSVVVASVDSLRNPERLRWFKPDVIITDEADLAAANGYQKVFQSRGVYDGSCFSIGCSATVKRADKQSLFAIGPDGDTVTIIGKSGLQKPAAPSECVYEKLVYHLDMLTAMREGWLVDMVVYTQQSQTDLSTVPLVGDDFDREALGKAVDNATRTNLSINAWKAVAADRPTLVFCASVEHAHHAAQMWREAGYTAQAIDGTTDAWERSAAFINFKAGSLQVITNFGVATRGTDLPNCSCIVRLRPSAVWSLNMQMNGRGTRPLPGILDNEQNREERHAAIKASAKPNCIYIDVMDLGSKHSLSIPSVLDLPANLLLEGESVLEIEEALREFTEEAREQIISDCPVPFREYKVSLKKAQVRQAERAVPLPEWDNIDGGFLFKNAPSGYTAELLAFKGEPDRWKMRVTCGDREVYSREWTDKKERKFVDLVDLAAEKMVAEARTDMQASQVFKPLGNFTWIGKESPSGRYQLLKAGLTPQKIDSMTQKEIIGKIKSIMIGIRAQEKKARMQAADAQQQEAA